MPPPIITRGRDGGLVTKPFSWSYSRLKNFESCPKKHYEVDIARNVKEEESEALATGNEAHAALAARVSKGTPLPAAFANYEPWAARVAHGGPGITLLVEQKLSITKNFAACGYFDKSCWFRGVGDVIKIAGRVALVVDWKTGKIVEDSVQLALMAQCIFSAYPNVERVQAEFIWLREDANTSQVFKRSDLAELWASLWPRIEQLEHAHKTTTYPAKPSGLCRKYCPVRECVYYGKGG
jgi:RecB family exonuclease